MLQETAPHWDLRVVDRWMPLDEKLVILFNLAVIIVVAVKVLRIWRRVPPFRRVQAGDFAAYLQRLQITNTSLKHWLVLPLLVWGFFACVHLQQLFISTSANKTFPISAVFGDLNDMAKLLVFTLLVSFFVFPLRWHILLRIERLRN